MTPPPVSPTTPAPQTLEALRPKPTRIWFDTEFFENGSTIKLISIGMVREDGETFYAETLEADDLANSDPWLRDNVRPHLRGGKHVVSKELIAERLRNFAGPNPEFWAYYADYDWVALCQLFGRMIDLPTGWPMYCRDLKQAIDEAGVGKPPAQTEGEHDALADAIWTRDAWQWLQKATPSTAPGWLDREAVARAISKARWPLASSSEQERWADSHWKEELHLADAVIPALTQPSRPSGETGGEDLRADFPGDRFEGDLTIREAALEIVNWFDKDGAVGTLPDHIMDLRAALASPPAQSRETEGAGALSGTVKASPYHDRIRLTGPFHAERGETPGHLHEIYRDMGHGGAERDWIGQLTADAVAEWRSLYNQVCTLTRENTALKEGKKK